MQLTDETPVKIVNHEDRRYTYLMRPQTTYGASTVYVLEANATAFWTWRVVKSWLGDPFADKGIALDIEKNRSADNFGRVHSLDGYVAPHIEVFSMEGDRIHMAVEPGFGEEGWNNLSVGISPQDMRGRMAALQAEMELLQANMSEQLPTTEALTPNDPKAGENDDLSSLSELPTDDSVTPGRAKSGTPRNPATPLRPSDLSIPDPAK